MGTPDTKVTRKVPRILVTGKDGQLGFELSRSLQTVGQVIAVGRDALDMTDGQKIRNLIAQECPDFIVNAAAYTAVDKAESDRETCRLVNAVAPQMMAEAALACGATLLHYSTDYVFDGRSLAPYKETDACAPESVYGATKYAGEEGIAASGAAHFIFRTSWVVGAYGSNFAKTVLRLAREREEIRIVADQKGAPTPAWLLADLAAFMIRSAQFDRDFVDRHAGVYHVSPQGETTWHGYAQHVVRRLTALGVKLRADELRVVPISTSEYPVLAKRPANSMLDTTKLRAIPGVVLPDWQSTLEPVLRLIAQDARLVS
ncbi:dTDP-4-dehydrorhamnose reductase [Paraburkholderia ginsengiterrae]|uniref:dTDP-4-dehydrorhamnose reductase n=1 Tax=Paraburkholderia ginsengiterrae TaxID=1462993 RepID=A0A1A9NA06_9BURK|nr:dTDP-4-dehydrorhamnose reductase [Paraburkholderia ginsengiterrae]OAJ59405.1 dTDP-4-dehydrorhamnose reductase [Paraburkholderia ginsengiterrae]OAJ63319.1 dTDP-4-dehydrorhamnose reductase [Paraburkholderia ginsengiterrae]